MLKKVAENIYQTQIPLPENPLRYINVYIIKGEDKTLVVDTGFNRPECEAALMEALGELGVQKADLFITHLHSDHCGLISKYGDQGWTIYAGETDGELMNFEAGNLYWRMLDDLFIKFGFPKADFGRNTDILANIRVIDHMQKKLCRSDRHRVQILAHRCQRNRRCHGENTVIKACYHDIVGHGNAAFRKQIHNAERHEVIGTDNDIGKIGQDRPRCFLRTGIVNRRQRTDIRPDMLLLQRI